MRKVLTLAFLFTSILLISCAGQKQEDDELFGLKGEVKKVLTYYYNRDYKLYHYEERRYSREGVYQEFRQYNEDGELVVRQVPIRDNRENLKGWQIYDGEGTLRYTSQEKKRRNKRIFEAFDLNGVKTRYIERFFENNKIVKIIETTDRKEKRVSLYTYDDNGDLALVKTMEDEKLIFSERYKYWEFDEMNNWTKLSIRNEENSSLSRILERTIAYY